MIERGPALGRRLLDLLSGGPALLAVRFAEATLDVLDQLWAALRLGVRFLVSLVWSVGDLAVWLIDLVAMFLATPIAWFVCGLAAWSLTAGGSLRALGW